MAVTYRLVPHPAKPTRALGGIEVTIQREAGDRIGFSYALIDDRAVLMPRRTLAPPMRREGLWKTTCFEAFLMPGEGPEYVEFNFAPNEDWAAYAFSGRREGGHELAIEPPTFWHYNGRGDVQALVNLHGVGMFAIDEPVKLGLSAVIEDRRGKLSYWALAHNGEAPDFHDPACFTARLAAPPRS